MDLNICCKIIKDDVLKWTKNKEMRVKNPKNASFVTTTLFDLTSDSPYSLLVFPEGVTTNGKRALLRFQEWPFKLGLSIQPVSILVILMS
jgi:1-acyl-sn-glycerol-3-phosphate acyltransferase